jgi:hypothetical protein
MTNVTKLASVALAALVLSTALVQAGMMNDAVSDVVQSSSSGGGFPGNSDSDNHSGPGFPFETINEDRNNNDSNGNLPYVDIGFGEKPQLPYQDIGPGEKPKLPIVFGHPKGGQKAGLQIDGLDLAIACKVAGTPTEFPDDLVLTNYGQPLAAGTTIKWMVKSAGHGHVQLAADLPTGGSAKASGVLAGGVEAGKPCTAKII